MSNIYIKLVANHPVLKQTIMDVMKMKREQGDNTPLFVAHQVKGRAYELADQWRDNAWQENVSDSLRDS